MQILVVVGLVGIACGEYTLLSKISAEFDKGSITDKNTTTKMCKHRSDIFKLQEMEKEIGHNSNQKDIQETINYLSSKIEQSGGICDAESKRPARNLTNPTSSDIAEDGDHKSELYESGTHKNLGSKTISSEAKEFQGNIEYPIPEHEGIAMDDYVELGVGSDERALCDDCQMDYDDQESSSFYTGIKEAEETGSRGSHKIAAIFIS